MHELLNSFKSQLSALGIDSKTKLHVTHYNKIEQRITEQRNFVKSKPVGLWYSIGFEWVDFTINDLDNFYSNEKLYAYEICTANLNILKLNTIEDVDKFIKRYKFGPDILSTINWKEVSMLYDGIEINNYSKIKKSPNVYQKIDEYIWLYDWDVSSGCIWNTKQLNIKEIK